MTLITLNSLNKVMERERMYSEAQRKGSRQADLELSLKNLNTQCEEVEKRKRLLATQVR